MRSRFRRLGVVALALAAVTELAVGFATPASAESNGGVRVMPLGASITDGFTVPGGYRTGLWQRMIGDGRVVDFVGSASNGPASLGDHDHEGHSGWRIDQIDANVVTWLRAADPRTILLHIGTNDVNRRDRTRRRALRPLGRPGRRPPRDRRAGRECPALTK